jgi:UDP-2,3-diacylglucosamine pyrophosphatase LpxH
MDAVNTNSLFVISDLHIGDGSTRDRFVRCGKEAQLWRFLEHVGSENGRLLIVGDLFELWRYTVEQVTERWHCLLDLLLQMNAAYIPGNHDAAVANLLRETHHPFFGNVQAPFTAPVGDRRFRFMHGHEVDPFMPAYLQRWGHKLGSCAALFEIKDSLLSLTNYTLSDVLYDLGEQLLRVLHWMTGNAQHAIHEDLLEPVPSVSNALKGSIRVQKMLSRFLYHREDVSYDVAVVGHTHKPGRFGQWYFNAGSWTRPTNNFLKIAPDGHVEVFDWCQQGQRCNPTLILDHPAKNRMW